MDAVRASLAQCAARLSVPAVSGAAGCHAASWRAGAHLSWSRYRLSVRASSSSGIMRVLPQFWVVAVNTSCSTGRAGGARRVGETCRPIACPARPAPCCLA